MSLASIEKNRFLGIYEKAINNKFTMEEKIDIAKKAGFDFIEFSVDESDEKLARLDWSDQKINELKKTLIDKDFYFNSMTLSAHRKYPFGSKDKKTQEKALEIMEKACILAKKLGIRIIQLATYDVYYSQGDDLTRKLFIEGMRKCARLAQKYSITLAFETMDTPFGGTISKCLNFLHQIDAPFFYVYPDLGNLYQFAKNDVENELELGKNKIVAFHFKDTKDNQFRDLDFGAGTVDFVRVLKHIKKLEINAPIMIEMWSKNEPNETMEENIKEIKKANDFYHKQWEKAGNDA